MRGEARQKPRATSALLYSRRQLPSISGLIIISSAIIENGIIFLGREGEREGEKDDYSIWLW